MLSAIIKSMIAEGCPPSAILAVVKTFEEQEQDIIEQRRKKAREKKAAQRLAKKIVGVSPVVPGTDEDNQGLMGTDEDKTLPPLPPLSPSPTPQPLTPLNPPIPIPSGASRGTRLSPDWRLPESWRQWAIDERFPAQSIDSEAAKFRDWWVSKAGAGGVKLDWQATWRNWIRRANEDQQKAERYANRNTPRQSPPPRQPRRFAEQDYNAGTEGFVLVD